MKRTYLIVGHSSGIGLALTRMALEAGHAVVGVSRRAGGITMPGLSERQADVLDVDIASLDLPTPRRRAVQHRRGAAGHALSRLDRDGQGCRSPRACCRARNE